MGIVGLIVLLNPAVVDWGATGELVGTAELLLNAILWAAVTIHVRRHRWTQSPLDLQPWQLLVALVPLAILALAVEHGDGIVWGPVTILVLLYSGPLATAFATWASQSVTRSLGPQASATGFLAVPVVGLLSGWLILGEALGPVDVLAFGLVLGGVGIASMAPVAGNARYRHGEVAPRPRRGGSVGSSRSAGGGTRPRGGDPGPVDGRCGRPDPRSDGVRADGRLVGRNHDTQARGQGAGSRPRPLPAQRDDRGQEQRTGGRRGPRP